MMKRKKNKLAKWANEHPVLGSFAVVILYVLFRRSAHFLFCSLLTQNGTTEVIHEIVDIIWPFLMVAAYEKLFIYKKGGFFHTLFLGTGLIIYGMIPFSMIMIDLLQDADIVWQSLPVILWNIAKTLFVGFREESCFRGIVVNLLGERYLKDRKGIMYTVLLSAFIFGIMHFQNMFIGMSFAGSLIQSMNAFFVGLIFAAVYLRGGSIWACILIHGFIDFGVSARELLTKTFESDLLAAVVNAENNVSIDITTMIEYLVLWLIYVLIALFLLRKKKCNELLHKRSLYQNE